MIQPEAKLLEAFPPAGPSLWTQETFFPKARGPGSRTKSVPLQPYIGAPAGRPRGCGARYPRENQSIRAGKRPTLWIPGALGAGAGWYLGTRRWGKEGRNQERGNSQKEKPLK